jgi:hypothetical protein
LIHKVLRRTPRPLVKTHTHGGLAACAFETQRCEVSSEIGQWLRSRGRFIYMYRDGREVMRSLHQFMQLFAPEARVPFSQFLRQEINGLSRPRIWAEHVRSWFAISSALCVSMEELSQDPATVLARLAEELKLPKPSHPPRLPRRCDTDFLSRLWRRISPRPASTAIVARPEHVQCDQWQDAFDDAKDREFFQREAGELLISLGYETSERWVETPAAMPAPLNRRLAPVHRLKSQHAPARIDANYDEAVGAAFS